MINIIKLYPFRVMKLLCY